MINSKWPEYMPGWDDDIYAIGMISLNYSQLEHMFGILFGRAVGMSEAQVKVLFQRIHNDSRLKIFEQLRRQLVVPEEIQGHLQHFGDAFKICAVNRNDIMHSLMGGRFTSESKGTGGMLLTKFSKSGGEIVCPVTLSDLRRVADEIHALMKYGATLSLEVDFATLPKYRQAKPYQSPPMLRKPTLPVNLDWRPLSEFMPQEQKKVE